MLVIDCKNLIQTEKQLTLASTGNVLVTANSGSGKTHLCFGGVNEIGE